MSGSTVATTPTPAKLTAATLMKSRRRTPSSSPVFAVVEPGADRSSVAMLTLDDLSFNRRRKAPGDAAPKWPSKRLAGLIAAAFRDVKGAFRQSAAAAGARQARAASRRWASDARNITAEA